MKPEKWGKMSSEEKQDTAKILMGTFRGQFIISQALVLAKDVLENKEYPETSNAEDMDMLLELFPLYKSIHEVSQ